MEDEEVCRARRRIGGENIGIENIEKRETENKEKKKAEKRLSPPVAFSVPSLVHRDEWAWKNGSKNIHKILRRNEKTESHSISGQTTKIFQRAFIKVFLSTQCMRVLGDVSKAAGIRSYLGQQRSPLGTASCCR